MTKGKVETAIKSGKDVILLLLHESQPSQRIKGRTRLVKMVFLFENELAPKLAKGIVDPTSLPEFVPYDYGPFSAEVYSDLDFLIDLKFISSSKSDVSEENLIEEVLEFQHWQDEANLPYSSDEIIFEPEEFSIASFGKQFVEQEILPSLTSEDIGYIATFVSRMNSASLRSVLKYVYHKYPKLTTKSKIADEI